MGTVSLAVTSSTTTGMEETAARTGQIPALIPPLDTGAVYILHTHIHTPTHTHSLSVSESEYECGVSVVCGVCVCVCA